MTGIVAGAQMATTTFEPVRVLGVDRTQAERLLRGRRVTPGEVESLAATYYPWRRHVHDPDSYWLTAGQAAEILGLTPASVRRLLEDRVLAHVVHTSGVRLMRRTDVDGLAAARSRWSGAPPRRSPNQPPAGRPGLRRR